MLASRICAPELRASSSEMWRKLARVATGMNTGVGMSPGACAARPRGARAGRAQQRKANAHRSGTCPRASTLSTALLSALAISARRVRIAGIAGQKARCAFARGLPRALGDQRLDGNDLGFGRELAARKINAVSIGQAQRFREGPAGDRASCAVEQGYLGGECELGGGVGAFAAALLEVSACGRVE